MVKFNNGRILYSLANVFKVKALKYLTLFTILFVFVSEANEVMAQQYITGVVNDAVDHIPLPAVTVSILNSTVKTLTSTNGTFRILIPENASQIQFSFVGYKKRIVDLKAVSNPPLKIDLQPEHETLNDVNVNSKKRMKYRNKDNPAVELIQKVIDNKPINQAKNYNFTEYQKYEKMVFSLTDIPKKLLDKKFLKQYRFVFDAKDSTKIKGKNLYPLYMDEKVSDNFYSKDVGRTKTIIKAHQNVNLSAFVDQKGLDIYLTRMYQDIDIYSNNIFIVTNQFLSPIADNARNYYKFFITDTVSNAGKKLIELSFTPRVKGDLLFEGKLFITLDGKFAVKRTEFGLNKDINLNWIRNLNVKQYFEQDETGHFYLFKSNMMVDFGLFKNGKLGVFGERNITLSNFKVNQPRPAETYKNPDSVVVLANAKQQENQYWAANRGDTLSRSESQVYHNLDSLQNMPSFKKATNTLNLLATGYKKIGAVELGPASTFVSFSSLEGLRLRFGGRTLPEFNKTWYFQGYGAYGFTDQRWKYEARATYSLNHKSIYAFPNQYISASFQRDTKIPGQELEFSQENSFLLSFKRGEDDKWLYTDTYNLTYLHEFENHFSYQLTLKNWTQTPAMALVYNVVTNDGIKTVPDLTSTEASLLLRWAPHEQFIQGKSYRTPITNKYPVISLGFNFGLKDAFNGAYDYQKIYLGVSKRFYMSTLGFTDIMIQGRYTFGKVPFPLLSTAPANQTYSYQYYAFNLMNFSEFVSDHSVSVFFDHSFYGFFLNKIPLIRKLKWRESISFKMIAGGLRQENNPAVQSDLYQFPLNESGVPYTYALQKTPYMEVGVGISNIFKVIRLDAVRRLNYLNNPDVSKYGIRASFVFDF